MSVTLATALDVEFFIYINGSRIRTAYTTEAGASAAARGIAASWRNLGNTRTRNYAIVAFRAGAIGGTQVAEIVA